jgi:hypothetical protein
MKNRGSGKIELVMLLLLVGIMVTPIVGYFKNIVKLVNCDFEAPYKTEIVRGVSLVPLIGMITGYMTIGEEKEAK